MREMRYAIEAFASRVTSAGKMAIDFGCGSQPYRPIFETRGATYRGADFAGPGAGSSDIAINANGVIAAADASADLVLSFQVLEHVRDLERYLSEARRILKDDGWLILSTHGTWLYHPHPEDHRRWTREGLLGDLSKNGFETVDCIPILGPLAWTTLLRLTMGYHALLRIPLIGKTMAVALALIMNLQGKLEEMITPDWVRRDNACVYVTLAIRETRMRLPRYLVVGITCAILNNILLIALAHMGLNFVAASVLAFWPVLVAGYALHTFYTFEMPASISSLLRYTLSMATNFPGLATLPLCVLRSCGSSDGDRGPNDNSSDVRLELFGCSMVAKGRHANMIASSD